MNEKKLNILLSSEHNIHTLTQKMQITTKIPSTLPRLHPCYVTGFSDGEASFSVSITKDSSRTIGWRVIPSFQIGTDAKDKDLLFLIQAYFGVGKVYRGEKNIYRFMVRSIIDLRVILDHFDKYPLKTQKLADFYLFKQVVDIIRQVEYLTPKELQQIVNVRASINKGLSDELNTVFPDTVPVSRPVISNQEIKDPYWLSGFTDAEGTF